MAKKKQRLQDYFLKRIRGKTLKQKNKLIILISFFIILLIAIPSSFASDANQALASDMDDNTITNDMNSINQINADATSNKDSVSSEKTLKQTDDNILKADNDNNILNQTENNILGANSDIYIDASVEKDTGDGTQENPYKYLTSSRIKSNSNIHLANGVYNLDRRAYAYNVNIIGSNPQETIIKYNGFGFGVTAALSFTNVTLSGITIYNTGELTATNTIFRDGKGYTADDYDNNFGGAIYTPYDSYSVYELYLTNCTFINNTAEYGGAVYMDSGIISIQGSYFINNTARNYGGAVALEYNEQTTISDCHFIGDSSINEAGGGLYVVNTPMTANNLEFINCTANFGAGLCSLNSSVSLSSIKGRNNQAKYNGGAIYHMYGSFTLTNSEFKNNNAHNGGALFIDNSTSLTITDTTFTNNNASIAAGAVYSLLNNLKKGNSLNDTVTGNKFISNEAMLFNDIYEIDKVDLNLGNGNYTMYQYKEVEIDELPSYYNLAAEGYVTSIKNQETSGNCWAFTAAATLESCILKASGDYYDFSEDHIKNLMAYYSDYGWIIGTNEGGYDGMPIAYLTSWLGPVLESEDPTDDKGLISPVLNGTIHVQNILFLGRQNTTDNDEIKEAIMRYGAVGTNLYYYDSYRNGNSYYYYGSDTYGNHAVTIVGWDDNYSKSNFYGSPAGNGAWIVKNSWGEDWGEDGYFYVSYYDRVFAPVGDSESSYTIILNDTIKLDKNYQYDIGGKTDYLYNKYETAWYKNQFVSSENEILAAVSTYFEKNTDWDLSINVNGESRLNQSGQSIKGYYTINLEKFIPLKMGDLFEVIFKITTDNNTGVPISEKVRLNKLTYDKNLSFISYDGINWIDLFDYSLEYNNHSYDSSVACIKAFTILSGIETSTSLEVIYNNYNPVKLIATVTDQYNNLVSLGNVTFNLNGEEIIVELVDGGAELVYNFEKLENIVSASFNSEEYVNSTNATTVYISRMDVDIDLNIESDLNNVNISITASKDINTTVTVSINEDSYSLELIDGKASILLEELDLGSYNVNAQISNTEIYNSSAKSGSFVIDLITSRINASDFITDDFSSAIYEIALTNKSGEGIANKDIVFIISQIERGSNDEELSLNELNKLYLKELNELNLNELNTLNAINIVNLTARTDKNGKANIPISLTGGDYIITVRFNGDDKYAPAEANRSLKVRDKINIEINFNQNINDLEISINLNKTINDTVNISFNGENYSVDIKDGEGKVEFASLDNGNYTATAELLNKADYIANTSEKSIEINVNQLNIVADYFETFDYSNEEYTVTLLDSDNNPIANKTIGFKINDETNYAITNGDGQAKIPINLSSGEYSVELKFDGDNEYFSSNTSNIIKVKDKVEIQVESSVSSNNALLNIQLSKIIDENVNIVLINKNTGKTSNYTIKAYNGRALLSIPDLEDGDYEANLSLGDNDKYISKDNRHEFSINTLYCEIISKDQNIAEYSNTTYQIKLVDEDGNPLANKQIVIDLNGSTYLKTTDGEGNVYQNINLPIGIYHITAKFEGDADYRKANSSNTIKVIELVTADIEIESDLDSAKITLKLSNKINETVSLSVNDKKYNVTLSNGEGSLELKDLDEGEYIVSLELNKYAVSENERFIIKNNISIIADDFTCYNNTNSTYTVQLFNGEKPLANKTISFVLNGEIVNKTTDNEGKASISINLDKGVYDIVIANMEKGVLLTKKVNVLSSITNTSSRKSTEVVLSDMVTTTISKSSLRNGEYFIFTLKDSDGNAISDKKIYLGFNGKKYERTTNENGSARVQVNLITAGIYTFAVAFLGDDDYNASFSVAKITVNKQKASLTAPSKTYKASAKTKSLTATFKDSKGNLIQGKKISFTVNGKTYTATTNAKGVATVNVSLNKKGTYGVTVKYAGDNTFNSISKTTKLTIK